jgi:putative ABC transport system ATP-binding protein
MNPLEARGLHRFYRRGATEVAALLDVSLACEPGETVAVTGPSGSGKSTLLALLAGLDHPDGGCVWLAGEQISHRAATDAARLRARHVGIVTQASGLFGHLTVRENVRFAAARRPVCGPSPDELIEGLGLAAVRSAYPRTLSGGETARAGLATALAGAPPVLLADEPTAEVSADEETSVLGLLRAWRPAHGATVLVTHADAVARYADRSIHLRDGRLA